MTDAVICEPLRTPAGGFGGSLRDVRARELALGDIDLIDLIELNEAVAAQILACTQEWGLASSDLDRCCSRPTGR